jgi:hypothetical protein
LDHPFFVPTFFLTIIIEQAFFDLCIIDLKVILDCAHIEAFPAYEYAVCIEQVVDVLSGNIPGFIRHHKKTSFIATKKEDKGGRGLGK